MTVDELGEYGMERMDDHQIAQFLSIQSIGVLGLSTREEPYLLPMSFGFDGESRLYFVFVVGSASRKAALASRAETASFLVYSAETAFHWRSVLVSGPLRELSEDERAELSETETPAWRPELFETVSEVEETRLFELRIEEWTGIGHDIRPPAYYQRSSADRSE